MQDEFSPPQIWYLKMRGCNKFMYEAPDLLSQTKDSSAKLSYLDESTRHDLVLEAS
jgi:hypothetical protein